MKTHHTIHRLTSALAAVLILLAGCDSVGENGPLPSTVTLSFEAAEETHPHPTGSFMANGALHDRGSFEEHMTVSADEEALTTIYGWRQLTGARGTAQIQYRGYAAPGTNRLRGESSIVAGTGAYADLVGSKGNFELRIEQDGSLGKSSMSIRH